MAKASDDIAEGLRFNIHPDMRDLLAAKKALPETTHSHALRSGWTAYAASMQRPYPEGMRVDDTMLNCTNKASAGAILVRIYRPKNAPYPSSSAWTTPKTSQCREPIRFLAQASGCSPVRSSELPAHSPVLDIKVTTVCIYADN